VKHKKHELKKLMQINDQQLEYQNNDYLSRIQACEQYNQILLYWLDRSPQFVRPDEVAELKTAAQKNIKKAHSRLGSATREEKTNYPNAINNRKEALLNYYQALQFSLNAIRTANGLMPESMKADTTNIEPTTLALAQTDELPELNTTISYTPKNLIFKVQIAAAPQELSLETLRSIYTPKPGEIINNEIEDNWYKYALGNFATYEQASDYKQSINVPDAFIIAYLDHRKIDLPDLIPLGETFPENSNSYRIQILATRAPASPEKVRQLMLGNQIVNITHQNGWYKYTIGNYPNPETAQISIKNIQQSGAFVVRYNSSGQEIASQ
jgi:hypothetical protein